MNPAPGSLAGVKIACFYPWVPFEPSGSWSRFTCLWRFLLGQGAEVTLAFLDRGNDVSLRGLRIRHLGSSLQLRDNEDLGTLAAIVREAAQYAPVERDLLVRYEKSYYLRDSGADAWLAGIVSSHDAIMCEYPMQAPLLGDYCRKYGRPLVVTAHDLLYELHGKNPKARQRLQEQELLSLRLADARVYCNDSEGRTFGQHGLAGVTVLNTGDAVAITPGKGEESNAAVRKALNLRTPHYCLFVGSAHGPNVEAVAAVRRLASAMPEMSFVVAGKCSELTVGHNYVATGPVTEALLDTLYRGALCVLVPLTRGTGTSVKLFQALTYGKAVVATPIGARGYEVADGRELLLVDTPADFAAAIRRLLAEPGLRQHLEEVARSYALRLDYRIQFQPYASVINRLLNRPEGAPGGRIGQALVLVDNNLADRVGHHYNYALSLRQQCEADGMAFAALIKRTAGPDVAAELAATRTFSHGIHEDLPQNPYPPGWGPTRATYDFLLANDLFARELEAGLAEQVRLGDTIFLPNATPRQILGLALLLQKSPVYLSLRYVLMLRFSFYYPAGPLSARKKELDRDRAEKYALAIRCLQEVDQLGAVRLVTDSAELAREYTPLSTRPIEVLPIPHTSPSQSAVPGEGLPAKPPGVRRIIYLGDAREEKGFELLPEAVRACAGRAGSAANQFVFQAFISSPYHEPMRPVINALATLKPAQVHLIEGPLSQEAYHALLVSADLVLLPYDAVTYHARTSGPFVEAICAGKPVVIPGNSWMSRELGASGAGTTFVSGQAQDFARAVRAALDNLPHHAGAAQELGRKYREFHNPTGFLKSLVRT
jgi:glycosyltransferase involved in cell wall biosynthesis